MASVTQWIALLEGEVGRGIYVWGGNGELLDGMANPEAWIERKETSADHAARAIALYRMRKTAGITNLRAFDCSGLMHWALKSLHILERDISARGLYARCKPLSDASELQPGDFVFYDNGEKIAHVGAYVGDGNAIESIGRDRGVVKTKLKERNWNRFGRLMNAFVDDPDPAAESEVVHIKGKSVRVRSGGSTAYPTVRIVHMGERYPLCGTAESGWYRIDLNGVMGYVTNKPRYTEVIRHA